MNYKHVLYMLLFIIGTDIFAQDGALIKDVELLEEQKMVLIEDYPHVFKEVEIYKEEKINPKHSKVYFTDNGVSFETTVN